MTTLVHKIAHWAATRPDQPAIHTKKNGAWVTHTWKDYLRDIRRTAKGLIALGLQPGKAVAMVGKNRSEWVISQFGVMAAGGVPAPIYTTNTKDQTAYIVKQSRSMFVVCDDREQLDKLAAARGEGLFEVEKIITMDDLGDHGPGVITLDALMKLGDAAGDAELDGRMAGLGPDQLGLLIYTSGTTGFPKGAEITHRGMTFGGAAMWSLAPERAQQQQITLSYLPLCHVAEQLVTNFVGLEVGSEVYFCDDLKKVKDLLPEVRPTVFLGVPRVWEKVEAGLRQRLAGTKGLKAKIASWARTVELEAFKRSVEINADVDSFRRRIAQKLFVSKVKGALGLDRMWLACSGAAPIATSTLEFFASLGIVIHEGFGMTETTGLATVSRLYRPVFGAVGSPLPGVDVKIAGDGEILLRGANMTKGYFEKPEETAALYTEDGWMKSGDLGKLEGGLLTITGRKKELIKTAGGKYVAPAEVEQHLAGIPGVGQTVVIGDRRPFLVLLLALDPEGFGALADAAGTAKGTIRELSENEQVRTFIARWIDEKCNAKLARYQTVKTFAIAPEPFSVDGGEVTPTMKLKRKVIEEKYAALLDALYAKAQTGHSEAA
jgi:long-subunit acyl-CoA synthetase (AMP-forming)